MGTNDENPLKSLFILGNPPFIGRQLRYDEQNADMEIACSVVPNYKTPGYVCAWYIKTATFLTGAAIVPMAMRAKHENEAAGAALATGTVAAPVRVAFVSTNSITQGEQVGALWNYLLEKGIKIRFAHRTNDEAVDACYGKRRFKNELSKWGTRLRYCDSSLFLILPKAVTPSQIFDSNEITCHDFCPHFSHFLLQCVLLAFLPRMPPRSHNELVCPRLQCTFHARESFSIASKHLFGKTAETNFWMKLIGLQCTMRNSVLYCAL